MFLYTWYLRTSNHEVLQIANCHDISWSYKDHKKLKKKLDELKIKEQLLFQIQVFLDTLDTCLPLFTYYSYYFQVLTYLHR